MIRAFLVAVMLFVCQETGQAQAPQRVLAVGPISGLVDPVNGNDANNCVTASCKTIGRLTSLFYRSYDLGCNTLTITAAPGTYAESVTLYDRFVGQCGGPGGVVFLGNPANAAAQLIQPPAGPAFAANYDAMFVVNGFKCDMSLADGGAGPGTGQDCIQVQNGGKMILRSFVFGDNFNPFGDMTVTGAGAALTVQPWNTPCGAAGQPACLGYQIVKDSISIQASWPGPGGSMSTIFVSTCAGVKPNMTVHGPGILPQVVASSCEPTHGYLTLTGAAGTVTGTADGEWIFISPSGGQHVAYSDGATIVYGTNGGITPFTVAMSGGPAYSTATIVGSKNGTADMGVVFTGGSAGYKYQIYANATLNSGLQGLSSLPGDLPGVVSFGGQAQ